MAKAYIITNSSGNRCGVTKQRYNELKDKEGYECEIVQQCDPEAEYPRHKGGGYYELSNGEQVRGKDNANEQEANL